MYPGDGPDNIAGDTVASARHPEYPPDDTDVEIPVTIEQLEDEPDGSPMETTGAQVDHQPQTLAVHIREHENIETAAQDRANATVDKMRQETERTYHFEFDKAIREIRSDQNRNFNRKLDDTVAQFREKLEALAMEYSGKLQDLEAGSRENRDQHDRLMEQLQSEVDRNREEAAHHQEELDKAHGRRLTAADEETRREREEQLEQYRKVCSDTTADLTNRLDDAIRTNARTIDAKLREHRNENAREQQRKTLELITAAEAKWKEENGGSPGPNPDGIGHRGRRTAHCNAVRPTPARARTNHAHIDV